jgi:NDP-sugar pyrophosphorylase family protein
MRPITERFAKPVLPIDGRPVIVSLLHELASAGVGRITVVTGHLAEQVERLLTGFPIELRFVRQPDALGSADAVRRAEPHPPALAVAADTLFTRGDLGRFCEEAAGAAGAIGVRTASPDRRKPRIVLEGDRVVRIVEEDEAAGHTPAPLWYLGEPVVQELDGLPGPPFELKEAFHRAIEEGNEIRAVAIGPTRDVTDPLDLVRENFSYLRGFR